MSKYKILYVTPETLNKNKLLWGSLIELHEIGLLE